LNFAGGEPLRLLRAFRVGWSDQLSWTAIFLATDLLVRIGIALRVIMRRQSVGVSLAWLMIVLSTPVIGVVIYLLIGELRLGQRPAQWLKVIHGPYQRWLDGLRSRFQVDWSGHGPLCEPLARLAEATVGIPAVPGGKIELLDNPEQILRSIIYDIDAAQRTCHLEFYIWYNGGVADEVAEALLRAAERGVICRVLLDSVGSRPFLSSPLAARLRAGGVHLAAALPVGLLRAFIARIDLRMHRKIVVIDGEIAYTGSQNLVDPRFFKLTAGVGPWVDAMVRLEGPAVEGLAVTFLEDWELETGEGIDKLALTGDVRPLKERGPTTLQVIPSGPLVTSATIQEIVLMVIYAARRELILTSPYFVPDEMLLTALTTAAHRGVDVTIIVPEHVDSLLVRLASQAHKDDLLAAGAKIALFQGGLLHTKSITIDGEISFIGSLNLDPRSFHLNFEITLAVYDSDFTGELRRLQLSYVEKSAAMQLTALRDRRFYTRLAHNVARLVAPLL
jgi:cardiolipin synthase